MTASDNSVINQTMKLIFAIKISKHSILKFHPKGTINISKNITSTLFLDSQSLINPLALFSSRYRLLVRSTDTLNKY